MKSRAAGTPKVHPKPAVLASAGLRPEDESLWREVSAGLRPLKSRRQPAPKPKPPVPPPQPEPPAAPGVAAGAPITPAFTVGGLAAPPQPVVRPIAAPRIDDKTARNLRRGKIAIDGRIDLHGMTETQAHSALLHFLSNGSGGRRVVLVITGKGERSGGLLRRSVPRWFSEPAFREMVSAYRPAGPSHGGDGALYVRLRNPARLRGKRP